jgi:hypothetical protein
MRFKIYTVVDITETNARRGEDKKMYSQQINYNTLLQTIGLRVNLNPIYSKSYVDNVDNLEFGKNITGKQRYWEFCFEVEYEGALSIDMMISDFDLVPVITDLDETAHNHNKIFRTSCPNERNIVFKILDNDK